MANLTGGMNSVTYARARQHVEEICSVGKDVVLVKSNTKDEAGSALTETTITLKAFPVRFTPFDRDVTNKIAWSKDVEVIAYISKKAFDDAGYNIKRLQKQYKTMRIDSQTYEIQNIDPYSPFSSDYLYIVIGGKL